MSNSANVPELKMSVSLDFRGKVSVAVIGTKALLMNPEVKAQMQEVLAYYSGGTQSNNYDKPKIYKNEGDQCPQCSKNLTLRTSKTNKQFLACPDSNCGFSCLLDRKSKSTVQPDTTTKAEKPAYRYMNAGENCPDCTEGIMEETISIKTNKPYLSCSNKKTCKGFAFPHKPAYSSNNSQTQQKFVIKSQAQ